MAIGFSRISDAGKFHAQHPGKEHASPYSHSIVLDHLNKLILL
jgi:hypothetical protein